MKPTLFTILVFISLHAFAQCNSFGPFSGSSFSDINNGSYSFSNPSYLAQNDNNRASASALISVLSGNTDHLQTTGFNFNIPITASICGIEVEVEKRASNISLFATITDHTVQLLKAGAITGNNKASSSTWSATEEYVIYGGITDLWGTTWDASDINDPDFGLSFSATINGLIGLLPVARVNHVQIIIYYKEIVLPLSIVFSAKQTNDNIFLSWQSPDRNKDACHLQRSTDGKNWSTIYSGRATDQYTDNDISRNTSYYYRIETGNNYSNVLQVTGKLNSLKVYPNPASDFIIVSDGTSNKSFATVTDMYGKIYILHVQTINSDQSKINIAQLPRGFYCLQAVDRTMRFMKL